MLERVEINPKEGRPQASVIWMHGLGADGHDFVGTIPHLKLPSDLPVRFVFPHAPMQPVTFIGGSTRAWFDIESLDGNGKEDGAGMCRSQQMIFDLIDSEISGGIASDHIVLAGFSQGGAMALQCGLRFPQKLAGILVLSAWLPLIEKVIVERSVANQKTPIFFGHGADDHIVHLDWAERSCEKLKSMGYSVEFHSFPMQHTICFDELILIGKWLNSIKLSFSR